MHIYSVSPHRTIKSTNQQNSAFENNSQEECIFVNRMNCSKWSSKSLDVRATEIFDVDSISSVFVVREPH